jgi:hypothetical protein
LRAICTESSTTCVVLYAPSNTHGREVSHRSRRVEIHVTQWRLHYNLQFLSQSEEGVRSSVPSCSFSAPSVTNRDTNSHLTPSINATPFQQATRNHVRR